jgi:hypothetical protein
MSLNILVGRNAKFCLGASGVATTSVLGVENLNLDGDWETVKKIYLQDSAKTTVMLLKNWTITGTLTEDMADAGQDFLRAAYNGGSNISFMLYPGTATATTTTYSCEYGVVPKYGLKYDPMQPNSASFTIESNGTALTVPT